MSNGRFGQKLDVSSDIYMKSSPTFPGNLSPCSVIRQSRSWCRLSQILWRTHHYWRCPLNLNLRATAKKVGSNTTRWYLSWWTKNNSIRPKKRLGHKQFPRSISIPLTRETLEIWKRGIPDFFSLDQWYLELFAKPNKKTRHIY